MNEKLVKWGKVVLIFPIVLVWDITYYIVKKVYQGATWIDDNGGNLIEKFVEDKELTWRK